MAKASQGGSSIWLAAGQEPPPHWNPDTDLLVGPGGAAAMKRYRDAHPEVEGTREDSGARGDEAPDVEAGEVPQTEARPDASMVEYSRPAGNATQEAWVEYIEARYGQEGGPAYELDTPNMSRNELRDFADEQERRER